MCAVFAARQNYTPRGKFPVHINSEGYFFWRGVAHCGRAVAVCRTSSIVHRAILPHVKKCRVARFKSCTVLMNARVVSCLKTGSIYINTNECGKHDITFTCASYKIALCVKAYAINKTVADIQIIKQIHRIIIMIYCTQIMQSTRECYSFQTLSVVLK